MIDTTLIQDVRALHRNLVRAISKTVSEGDTLGELRKALEKVLPKEKAEPQRSPRAAPKTINGNGHDAVREAIKGGAQSVAEIATATKLDKTIVRKALNELLDLKEITRSGLKRGTKYAVAA